MFHEELAEKSLGFRKFYIKIIVALKCWHVFDSSKGNHQKMEPQYLGCIKNHWVAKGLFIF